MASLKLDHIYKVYPNGVKAVNDFTMDIRDGEFIVFVGPSGCGKSTTLRMIAGLEEITAGELYINNNIVNSIEPKDRDVAMVFQNYALYPHMTIYENMAFGLKLRHVKNDEIHEKVLWAAEVLGIKEYLDRKPKAMSGGQRQRVALGRAILRDPKVMLLDEPLSNLDAKLRTQMRSEIAKLHQNLKTTFIYVTHDQTEAMTLGTRVVVMKDGFVQQIDTPHNLYAYPQNKFVAGFIGTPQMNFFQGTLKRIKDKIEINFAWSDAKITVPYEQLLKVKPSYLDGNQTVYIGVRCENISLAKPGDTNIVKVKVSHFEDLGSESLIYGDINMEGDGFTETSTHIIIKSAGIGNLKPGDVIDATIDMSKAHFFDKKTEQSILPRIPTENVFDCSVSGGILSVLNYKIHLPSTYKDLKVSDATISIPNTAIKISTKGKYEAKVIMIENIDDTKLLYLSVEDRTFFVVSEDESVKVGDTIKFGIDVAQIRVFTSKSEVDEDGNEKTIENDVITPLVPHDRYFAQFYNYDTIVSHNSNPVFSKYKEDRIAKCSSEYEAKKAELQAKLDADLAENSGTVLAEKLAKAQAHLVEITEKNNSVIAEENKKADEALTKLKAEHNEKRKAIKANNKAEYARRVAEEKSSYAKFLKDNVDKLMVRRRKEEHRMFKETAPAERERDLERDMTGEALNYETLKSAIKSERRRNVSYMKNQINSAKKEIAFLSNPEKNLRAEFSKDMAKLAKEEKRAMRLASLLFFFGIDGHYIKLDDNIANKMVQGLGTRVFSKEYLVEVPHDAYIENEEGFEVTVEKTISYGDDEYYECSYVDALGVTKVIYIRLDKKLAIGNKMKVIPDISKTMVTETSMNIRLY